MGVKVLRKTGQEEMVGFGIIAVIITLIMFFLLVFYITKRSEESLDNSYEIESFIQAMLQYTTDCKSGYLSKMPIERTIEACRNELRCENNGRNACDVLNDSLIGILDNSFLIGEGGYVRGYEITIKQENENILYYKKGNQTQVYKGATQILPNNKEIIVRVYY
ncbi:MAG: hypothetical protein QXU40_00685 [Candidatus Pacearchaeota archaeon]